MRFSHFAFMALLGSGLLEVWACTTSSSGDDDGYGDTDAEGRTATGVGTTTGTNTSTGTGPIEDPHIAPEGRDGGADPDAELTCEGLDPSQPVVLYLSADDSNSMGSPALAREWLNYGLPAYGIRTYEFLNYYRIDYPAPPAGQLRLIPQLQGAAQAGDFDLQIGVRSFDAVTPRRPMTITFVLDTSGSMGGAGIERENAVVVAVAQSLRAGDVVNMVTWNTSNNVLLSGHTVAGPNDPTLIARANELSANGGTDLNAGLIAGYDLAWQHYGSMRLNRVILVSDGGANVGVTDEQLIALHAEDADQDGIYLVGVGTGPANGYGDRLMDAVTDLGRGAYVYIDTEFEAEHMFIDRFDEVMEVAARAVQVELTLPWYFQMHRFYGEEYSADPDEVTPQHLAPSDAMIFNQVIRACDPALVSSQDIVQVRAHWETPLSRNARQTAVSVTVGELLAGPKSQLRKGKAIVAYAEALKSGAATDLQNAHAAVVAANLTGNDPELSEIALLLRRHPSFP